MRYPTVILALMMPLAMPAQALGLGDLIGAAAGAVLQQAAKSGDQVQVAASSGQSVESTVGKTYSDSGKKAGVSLAEIASMPSTIPPILIPFKESGVAALAGRPKIVISGYSVSFIRSAEAFSSTASGGGLFSNARRAVKYQTVLTGVKEALFAQLAEQAHQDLVKRLDAAGIAVASHDSFKAALGDSANGFWIEGNQSTGSRKLDGRADKSWLAFGAKDAPLVKIMAMDFSAFGFGPTMITAQNAAATIDAVVIHPLLVLDYIALDSGGNSTFARTASISAETVFSISPASRIDFGYKGATGSGSGALTLGGGVFSTEPFAVINETGDRSDNVAVHNAIAMLGMGSVFKQSKVFAVEAAEERYVALVRAAYEGFNQGLVDRLLNARGKGA